jgi:hypothetical protein
MQAKELAKELHLLALTQATASVLALTHWYDVVPWAAAEEVL